MWEIGRGGERDISTWLHAPVYTEIARITAWKAHAYNSAQFFSTKLPSLESIKDRGKSKPPAHGKNIGKKYSSIIVAREWYAIFRAHPRNVSKFTDHLISVSRRCRIDYRAPDSPRSASRAKRFRGSGHVNSFRSTRPRLHRSNCIIRRNGARYADALRWKMPRPIHHFPSPPKKNMGAFYEVTPPGTTPVKFVDR